MYIFKKKEQYPGSFRLQCHQKQKCDTSLFKNNSMILSMIRVKYYLEGLEMEWR